MCSHARHVSHRDQITMVDQEEGEWQSLESCSKGLDLCTNQEKKKLGIDLGR